MWPELLRNPNKRKQNHRGRHPERSRPSVEARACPERSRRGSRADRNSRLSQTAQYLRIFLVADAFFDPGYEFRQVGDHSLLQAGSKFV